MNISELIEIAKIDNEEIRKIEISLLNLPERLDFWDYLITFKVNNGNFSVEQKQLLMDMKNSVVKPNVFANKNLQEILRVQYLPLISKQFKEIGLTGEDLDHIFINTSITNFRTLPGNETKKDCQCNVSSLWGCWGCRSTNNCNETGAGCGFLTFFSCDGSCEAIKSLSL